MSCTFACVWDCVGVKPRKLELKRRIEEDTAIVRAVSPPSVFLLKVHPRHLLRDIGGGVFLSCASFGVGGAVLGRRVEDNAPYQNDNPQTW